MTAGNLTLITSERPATLGKTFSLDAAGALQKRTAGHMTEGRFQVAEFADVKRPPRNPCGSGHGSSNHRQPAG